MPDWRAAWAAVRERMRRELGDPVFDAWIGPLNLESFDADELKIGAAKPFVRNWVANHYVARIEKAFRGRRLRARLAGHRDQRHARARSIGGAIPREAQHQGLSETRRQRLLHLAAQRKPQPRRRQGPVEPDAASPADLRQLHSRRRQPVRPWRGAQLRRRPAGRHSAALHPWRLRLRQDASAERRGAGIPQARQAHAVPARRRFHAPLPGRALSQGHAGLQGRAAHRRSADHRRSAAYLPLGRHGVGVPLHRQRLCRSAPPGGDRRRPRARRRWKAWAPT